jgi:peptide/nickel transport system permease protein
VLVLIGASLLLFFVLKAAPAETRDSLRLMGETAEQALPQGVEGAVETGAGSAAAEYIRWLGAIAMGDFGSSTALQRGRPASVLIWPSAARSFVLLAAGMTLAMGFALCLAAARIRRGDTARWRVFGAAVGLLSAIPVFLYVYVFVSGGNRLISFGASEGWWVPPPWFPLPMEAALLPWLVAALILAVGDGGLVDLYQRFHGEMGHAAKGDYMTGVRMLGLSVPGVVARGFIPGALSHVSRRVSFFLGSLVVLEAALGWPGLGYLAWRAAAERDMPVLLGSALVMATALRLITMGNDLASFLADPRRRGRR